MNKKQRIALGIGLSLMSLLGLFFLFLASTGYSLAYYEPTEQMIGFLTLALGTGGVIVLLHKPTQKQK